MPVHRAQGTRIGARLQEAAEAGKEQQEDPGRTL